MICGGVGAVFMSLIFAKQLVPGAGISLFVRVVIQFIISSFLLSYLMTDNVLAFFRLRQLDTGQTLGILFGLAFGLTLLLQVAAYFVLSARFAS